MSDEELIAQARGNSDPEASRKLLDELFQRYHSRIALWCYRVTGNQDSAGDLAQEVLLSVYRNLESFRGDSKFSTWLYTITRNHCLNDYHKRAARKEQSIDPIEEDFAHEDRFDLRMEREQQVTHMRELLQSTLDETEHRVMTLHYGEEMTLDAITRVMGLENASGAKAYIVSARRKLKTAVDRWRAKQQVRG